MNNHHHHPDDPAVALAVALVVGFLASLFIVALALGLLIDDRAWRALLTEVIVAVPALCWYRRNQPTDGPRALLQHRELAVAAGLQSLILGSIVFTAATWFVPEPPSRLQPDLSVLSMVVYLVAGTVCVGVVEEVVFRGILQGALSRRFGPALGVAMASVAFGAAHLLGGYRLGGFLSTTANGALFGWLALRTRSVWPAAMAHASHNALVLISSSYLLAGQALVIAMIIYLLARIRSVSKPADGVDEHVALVNADAV